MKKIQNNNLRGFKRLMSNKNEIRKVNTTLNIYQAHENADTKNESETVKGVVHNPSANKI